MKEVLERNCSLLVENRLIIKREFGFSSSYSWPLCAAMYTARGEKADAHKLRECLNMLKGSTSAFSYLRGEAKLATATTISLSENPQKTLDGILKIYELLKRDFFSSPYLPVAALSLSQLADEGEYESVCTRARRIYKLMKENHPFLTSSEDSVFAALLAVSPDSDDELLSRDEECYRMLKPEFFFADSVQSLSHVLAMLSPEPDMICAKVLDVYEKLKYMGLRYGSSYELPTLGTLAAIDVDAQQLVSDVSDAESYLRNKPGFGAFGIGKKQRIMYAGIVTGCEYYDEKDLSAVSSAAAASMVSLIIAQQAAVCAAIAASAASSSSN